MPQKQITIDSTVFGGSGQFRTKLMLGIEVVTTQPRTIAIEKAASD
jgi:hypothetical protein